MIGNTVSFNNVEHALDIRADESTASRPYRTPKRVRHLVGRNIGLIGDT